jgi:diadenosine tetraphosphate (Ap4A) HIT family hydrolase
MPVRHVVHVSELTPSESAELGPSLQRASAAGTATMNPEQVYVCLWSHAHGAAGHLHFVVQPACRGGMTRYGACGPVLQMAMFEADQVPSKEAVEGVCIRLRSAIGA